MEKGQGTQLDDWRVYNGEPKEAYAIMFHHFHHSGTKPYGQGSITAEDFREMLDYINSKKENRILNALEFASLHEKGQLKPWHVCLTFDNATFKQGSRGTVIEATSRKDGKLKVKLDNDDTKTLRLIKECDLQLYEGVASSPNCKSQTEEESFEYTK